jgi:hypothetical protein
MRDIYPIAKALNRIATSLEDISRKLDHIIEQHNHDYLKFAQ